MAKGGARPGAGRPKGSKMLDLRDYMKEKDIKEFFTYLMTTYQTDSRIAVWVADHLFGKAPQPLTGADGGAIEFKGVEIKVRK